ncbi:hypothetical protein C5E45_23855 [Nocardia nova]|uniref:DUF8175 domain-containing protein n=1 Tax=Nocardia nova TaxID=37330 RepID=A0A2S6AKW3_9NOCA|nr:hypothetical protein [Nocardia nova]PPJ35843.1 hypothetical protein C5E45_23855 [Nocardia nova]
MTRLRHHLGTAAALTALVTAGCSHEPATTAPLTAPVDLRAAPEGVSWTDYHGIKLPAGADGPRENREVATGFAHTPAGAALAAIVHTVHMSIAPNASWPAVAHAEIAPTGRDDLVVSRGLLSVDTPANPVAAPRIRGYTITDWQPSNATVRIYTSFPDQSIAVNKATVVWQGGDWLLRLPDPASTERVVVSTDRLDPVVRLEAPQ